MVSFFSNRAPLLYWDKKYYYIPFSQYLHHQSGSIYHDHLHRCPKMNTTQRYLVSPAEIAHALSKRSKNDHIRRIIELVGEDRAGLLLLKFAGETISFPRKSSLWRIAKAEYIQKELRPFRKNPHEFKIKVRKLSRLLKMSRPSVIRTLESGRYSE